MNNLYQNAVILQTPPTTISKDVAVLNQSDFDSLIWNKGYNVYYDKAIKCPCRNISDNQALTTCHNCGGSGWVFINKTKTKMVFQSMNIETKYKDWSEVKLGTVRISSLNKERVSFMDRVTLIDSVMTTSQILHFKMHSDDKLRAMCIYPIKSIEAMFMFSQVNQALTLLKEGEDFIIKEQNWIELDDTFINVEHPTITIRYEHNPMYHIIDTSRNIMTTDIYSGSDEKSLIHQQMPLFSIGRLAHYVLDEEVYNGDYLFDNSFVQDCQIQTTQTC